jgi:hypothetical protein
LCCRSCCVAHGIVKVKVKVRRGPAAGGRVPSRRYRVLLARGVPGGYTAYGSHASVTSRVHRPAMEVMFLGAAVAERLIADIASRDSTGLPWCPSCPRLGHAMCRRQTECSLSVLLTLVPSRRALWTIALSRCVAETETVASVPGKPLRADRHSTVSIDGADSVTGQVGVRAVTESVCQGQPAQPLTQRWGCSFGGD